MWSRSNLSCVSCRKVEYPHKGHGLCVLCYGRSKKRYNVSTKKTLRLYRENNRGKMATINRSYSNRLRDKLFAMLGDVCASCGFSDRRALQIDHVNSDGAEDRRLNGNKNKHLLVIRSLELGEKRYQLLCANCNWIKRHERQEWGVTGPKKGGVHNGQD